MTEPAATERPDDDPLQDDPLQDDPLHDDPPPLGSWRRMYTLVLANLAALIVFFYIFMKVFE